MGSHKRSFQCFDAILDEPSLNSSLSFRHQSAASHMGSPGLNRLMEDRGCYLCADHQQATAMTSEASGTYSAPWYHYQTHPHAHQYMSRRPARPEEAPGEVEDHHHHHRQSRRIVLVKNSDPAVRRSIVLQHRSLRSLGLFLEEVSELMQCLIRKLYTLDGHKVDSVQSLLQCSGVLVCVGREPFHPLLLDSFRKNSHDKLPKLNLNSRSSVGSDEQTAKTNGLDARRSVIHPKCDSSNRSARLMMSPENFFPNGLNSLSPEHAGACPHGRQGLMDDDIEKRVLVNKDGSLSMEMKVRFRLLGDETLRWSTEIKKSTSALNESHIAQDDACCVSHSSAESCSEAESLPSSEADETYTTKRYQRHFEEPHCQHCSAQSQEYDIWKNPILSDQTAVRHIRSSSSSASSHRIVRKKASSDSMRTMSSEEYTEHVVEKATCIEQTIEQQGDTTVKHCTINCCCSVSSKPKTTGPAEEKCGMAEKTHASDHDESRPDNYKDSQTEQLNVQITEPLVEDERPVSTVSSSSQILASLKEDQDEEDLDLPSISRASYDHGQQEDEDSKGAESNPCSDTPCRSPASMTYLSPRPPSKPSSLGRSKTCQKFTPTEIDVDQDDQNVRPGSAESALFKALSGCRKTKGPESKNTIAADVAAQNAEEHNNTTEERSSSAMSVKSNTSGKSSKSNITEVLEQENSATLDGRAPSAMSTKSQKSENSKSEMSENLPEDQKTEVRTSSAMSVKSNTSVRSKRSDISENVSDQLAKLQDAEERTASATSGKSNMSAKSSLSKEPQSEEAEGTEEPIEEQASNAQSATSNRSDTKELTNDEIKVHEELEEHEQDRASSRVSVKSSVSQKSKSEVSEAASFQEEEELQDRTASVISATLVQSYKCHQKSNVSTTSKVSEGDQEQIKEQDIEEVQERASSAISAKSSTSTRSRKSEVTPTAFEMKERASSAMSSQSKASLKSNTSKVSSVGPEEHMDREETEERACSAMSAKSEVYEVKSEKSQTSDLATVETVAEEHTAEVRSASAMSSKSNVSVKSEISEPVIEAPVKTDKQNKGRSRNASSANSIQSGISQNATDEADVSEDRAQSIMSSRSSASERSRKSNISKAAYLLQGEEQQTEERSQSVEADDKEKEDRAPSAMSGRSHISTKSGISAKSKASKISEVSLQEPDDEEHEEKTPSVMSMKSSVSSRSNKSKHSELVHGEPAEVHNKDRPPSAISSNTNISTKSRRSMISEATYKEKETTAKEEIKERALSGMSAKSGSSARTRTSKVSEIMIDEPNQPEVERASSSRSLKSDVSERSNKSKVIEAGPEDLVNEDKDKEERTASVVSSITTVSARSMKSSDSVTDDVTGSNVEETAPSIASVTSAQSTRSNISDVAPDETEHTGNGDVGRSVKSSNVLARSNASTKSKNSLLSETQGPGERSASVMSSTSTASQVSKADVEKNTTRSPSQMSAKSNVSARSKKSKVSKAEDHRNTPTNNIDMEFTRDKSPVAVNSNKCVCGAVNKSLSPMVSSEKDSDHEEIPGSPLSTKSAKSKISSSSERVLTPTSTSVSIGIIDDCEDDDVEKTDEGAVSVHSRTSASSQTEICAKSDEDLLESPLQMTNKKPPQERSESFTSAKSNISDKSKRSRCSSALPVGSVLDTKESDEVTSNVSFKTKNLMTSSDCHTSTNRQSSPTQEIWSSSKTSNVSVHSCGEISAENSAVTGQGAAESPDVSHKSQSICSKCSSTQNRGKMATGPVAPVSPVSSASATSGSRKSRNKARHTVEMIDRPNSNISNSSSHLQVHDQKIKAEDTVSSEDGHSVKSNKSRNKSTHKHEEDVERCHSATLSVPSGYRLSPSPPKSPKKSKRTVFLGSNDSLLSQTVPVPDTREQHADNLNTASEEPKSIRPDRTHNEQVCVLDTTDCIPNISDNKSEKSSKCRKRAGSSSSCQKTNDISEMSPSCLPNASPTEVVNEWLRKIPSDAALCDLADEFHENFDAAEPLCTSHVPPGEKLEHESLEEYGVTKLDQVEDGHLASEEGATDKKSQENHVACKDGRQCIRPQAVDEPKILDSSVLVMKVLLSPKLDRCHSLPEVSPVCGRKLSTAAQGLLDCLAKLKLLDFGPTDENGIKAKYQELMSMLKSLWLCDSKDREKMYEKRKSNDQQPQDEELKARSSSGVDVHSGSTSSGKSSALDGTQAQTNPECEAPDTLTKLQEVDETSKVTIEEKLKDDVPGSDETIRNNDSPRQLMETPPSSNISSGNNPNNKESESDHQEDTSSGSPPAPQRPQLSKRVSQDSDPVWVLNLLNKLEKQFMTHYVKAMDEFKVRWNLDDNEQLDIMICDLQHEVHRRIQSSIDRELKKIQGRAGRPRPPKEAMSRESTAQTEQRRRRLKVMRNHSVDPQTQQSDDDYTASGTDFSDQRSDDAYCPCDACVKKKMASMPVLPAEMFNAAPVMMDFDLRRILQIKKSAPNNEKIEEVASECKAGKMQDLEENVTLEAVKEEDEKEGTEHLRKSRESEDGENDDSSNDEDDASEKQSDLKKDINGDVEISDNMMAERNNEGEKKEEKEEEGDDEADSDVASVNESSSASKINEESENISEDAGDVMQVETEREKDRNTVQESDKTAEDTEGEHETKTAEESETAGDETAEEGETAGDKTAEESETAGDETEEESETAEDKTAEESETAGDETADKGETAEDTAGEHETKTAEESETAGDETAEEGETADDEALKDGHNAQGSAGESETADDNIAEEGETANTENTEEGGTTKDKTSEDKQTAETAREVEIAEDENVAESDTVDSESAEKSETSEDGTSEYGQTAGEDETANDDTAEECETCVKESVHAETATDVESAERESAEECETTEDETAEDGRNAKAAAGEGETAEDETAEDGQNAKAAAGEGETAEDETAEDGRNAKAAAGEGETAEDEAVEDGQTEESEAADEETAAEQDNAQSETIEHTNPEDTGCDDAIELKANEEKSLFKNEGDVGINSIEDKGKESGKDDAEERPGDEGHHCACIGESAEGGDEAEDDTEPDMEIDEGKHNGKVQTLQPSLMLKQNHNQLDETTVVSSDAVVNHNSVYDADVEDSEAEIHNQVQDLNSESQRKTTHTTLKTILYTLAFLKHTTSERPKVREEEDGDDEDEHEEPPDRSDNAEDSSCVEKDECEEVDGKEKGTPSGITEDTAEEEDQENETCEKTKDYSEDSEWESSENVLEKQFTKSSVESQPGSFEVLDDQIQSQKDSNHER